MHEDETKRQEDETKQGKLHQTLAHLAADDHEEQPNSGENGASNDIETAGLILGERSGPSWSVSGGSWSIIACPC